MKHAKKLLALLLALIVALGLGVSAMAEEPVLGEELEELIAIDELPEEDLETQSLPAFAAEAAPQPDPCLCGVEGFDCPLMPVIVYERSPEDRRIEVGPEETIIALRARLPAGVDDEIGFRWYVDGEPHEGVFMYRDSANEVLHRLYLPSEKVRTVNVYVEVYNQAHPDHYVTSRTARVEFFRPPAGELFQRGFKAGLNIALMPIGVIPGVFLMPYIGLAYGGLTGLLLYSGVTLLTVVLAPVGLIAALPLGLIMGLVHIVR